MRYELKDGEHLTAETVQRTLGVRGWPILTYVRVRGTEITRVVSICRHGDRCWLVRHAGESIACKLTDLDIEIVGENIIEPKAERAT